MRATEPRCGPARDSEGVDGWWRVAPGAATRGDTSGHTVNLWAEHLLPRVVDRLLTSVDVTRRRRQALVGLHGRVVEIGFGAGPNVPLYPAAVTSVDAVEPSPVARRLAADRLADSTVEITFVGLDGQDLPLADHSYDSALSTFTLCTVPDPDRALRELRRVLRPGSVLHVLEHGLSPDPRTARWQHRLNPVERALAGGCNLDRPIDRLLTAAGFTLEHLSTHQLRGPRVSRPWGHLTVARARTPTTGESHRATPPSDFENTR